MKTKLTLLALCLCSLAATATPLMINGVYVSPTNNNQLAAVALAWDQSPDPTVSGYHLYYGAGTYTNYVTTSSTSATVSNLALGSTFHFSVTAFSTNGLESDFSQEVSYHVPNPPINTTNLHSPVVLVVMKSPSATSSMWAEVGGFEIDPTLNQFFKFELQKNQVAVTTPAIARKTKTPPPPLPGQ